MKNGNVIELSDSDDEVDTTVRPVKQEQSVVRNDQPVNEISSKTSATDGLNVTIKTERVDESEYDRSTEVGSSSQQIRPPTPLISYNDNSQVAKHFERFGERPFTFELSNQVPITIDLKIDQSASQPTDNVDEDQEMVSDSFNPNASEAAGVRQAQATSTSTSLLASNEQTETLNSVMNDHQYARANTSTESPADAIDKSNGENLQQELDTAVTVKGEPMDDVEPTQPEYNYYPEVIDLISDQEDAANETTDRGQNDDDDDDDDQSLAANRRQKVYNTRAGGHFKAGHWQKLTNQQTGCNGTKCSTCNNNFANPNERPHKCSTCPKRFARARDLVRHMKGHENQFRCAICHVGLPDARSCQSHKYHCKYTRFHCHLCKKQLGNIKELLKHSKRMHIGKIRRRLTCPARLPNSKFYFDMSKFKL